MRNLVFSLLILALTSACSSTPPPPPTMITKVQFVNEIRLRQPVSVAVDREGTIYSGMKDGSIEITSATGQKIAVIPGRDAGGEHVVRMPSGIAVAGEKIYVADQRLERLAVFSKEGRFIESFGEDGSGFKEFDSPQGITVQDSIIYVADTGNARVQILDESGVFLRVVDGVIKEKNPLKKISRLQKPIDVAVDHRGNLYVVDAGDDAVKIYNQAGEYLDQLPDLVKPIGITIARDGIYVADGKSYSVKKYDFNHAFRLTFGSRGNGRAQFAELTDIASDIDGKVYVADREKGQAHVFLTEQDQGFADWRQEPPRHSVRWQNDIALTSIKTAWDGKDTLYAVDGKSITLLRDGKIVGNIPSGRLEPVSVAVGPGGAIWVLDGRDKKVSRLDGTGKVSLSFGNSGRGAGDLRRPTDLAVSSAGLIFVADPGSKNVQVFNGDGVFLNAIGEGPDGVKLRNPLAVAISPNGNLHVLDSDLSAVFSFAADGTPLRRFGQEGSAREEFDEPVDLAATGSEIFVLDKDGNSIKVFSHTGNFIRSFGCKGNGGKGDFKAPEGITALDEVTLYVSDTGNRRLQVLRNVYSPAPPSGLTAESGMRLVKLSWLPSSESYIEKYQIFKAAGDDGSFVLLGETREPRLTDPQVEPDLTYHYRVAALATMGNSSRQSDIASAVPTRLSPAPPSGLQITTDEWSATLSWTPGEEFITHYRIFRKKGQAPEEIATVTEPAFTEGGLSSSTEYKYLVSAVSSDGVESDKVAIAAATKKATKPPLEIDVVDMQNVFSNTYKNYETAGIGWILITNNTGVAINKIKVSFSIKDFMDFPTELKIESLPPRESREFDLKAVFNNNILTVTEDTPVQTSIEASYYENDQIRRFVKNYPINIYEKHRMMWEKREQFATFITPKDPVLLEFVRSVAAQYRDDDFSMLRSAAVFDALGVLGLAYIPDPSNPYQITSGRTDYVDYIQYPQETLQRKSGDCDDLVALYSSALESLGMRTQVIEVPGHMLMMFSTGMPAAENADTMDGLFIVHEGLLWVAVETTMVGASFIKAWEKGSETYHTWRDQGLTLLDIRQAWSQFKPASLLNSSWRPTFVKKEEIDAKFGEEFSTIKRIGLRLRSHPFSLRVADNPLDVEALIQIGIIYGKAGETADALAAFEKVVEIDPGQAAAFNNIGNLHYIEGRYEEACAAYEKAAEIETGDAMIWINLARCNLQRQEKEKARIAFEKAREVDGNVVQMFRILAMELMSAI